MTEKMKALRELAPEETEAVQGGLWMSGHERKPGEVTQPKDGFLPQDTSDTDI